MKDPLLPTELAAPGELREKNAHLAPALEGRLIINADDWSSMPELRIEPSSVSNTAGFPQPAVWFSCKTPTGPRVLRPSKVLILVFT